MPTPIARAIEIPLPEKFQSFSPVRTASAAEDPDSEASSPPATTPIDATPFFGLSSPPRPSLSTSKIEFDTPPPPEGLPDLLDPPSSSEDETGNIDVVNRQSDGTVNLDVGKTPPPAGVWAATPAPAHSQTPQPTSSSFVPAKLSRARSNPLPQTSFTDGQSSTVALPSGLSCAGSACTNTCAIWGLVFNTWLTSSEEPDEGSIR